MKRTLAKTLRSGLALVLAFCMTFGLCGTALATKVAATETDTKTINYVSLGDSMTNGYGLNGYTDVDGFMEKVADAYPTQVAEELGWDLTAQLATSAMRAEDLHYILEYGTAGAYAGDEYTKSNFINGRWNDWNETEKNTRKPEWAGTANVAKIFRENVAEADVISFAVGNANFGVFLMYRITNLLGIFADEEDLAGDAWIDFENALANLTAEQKEVVMNIYNEAKNLLKAKAPGAESLVDGLGNVVGYTVASYLANVDGALDRINELNDDAEIIIVGIMNTFSGMNVVAEYEGQQITIDMGTILAPVIEGVNAYLAALPTAKQAAGEWTGNTFYYAEATNVAMNVSEYKNQIYDYDNVIRERFVEEVVSVVFNEDMLDMESITLEEVVAYEKLTDEEKLGYALNGNAAKASAIAAYLAFEKAVLASTELDALNATAFLQLVNGLDNVFENVFDKYDENLKTESVQHIGTAWNVVKTQIPEAYTSIITEDVFKSVMINGVDATFASLADQMLNENKTTIMQIHSTYDKLLVDHAENADTCTQCANTCEQLVALYSGLSTVHSGGEMACTLLATPVALSSALQADSTVFGLLNLFARMLIGNGIGCHPSAAGHDTLTAAIVKSYEGGYTTEDATVDKVISAATLVADLAAEYYDEAYAYAYAEAKNAGYIDTAVAAIDTAIEAVNGLDFSGIEMTAEFASKIPAQAKAVTDTLEAAKDLIVEADVLDQAALDSLLTLLDEAEDNLDTLLDLLTQAGVDVNKLVIKPALDKAYEEISKAVTTAKEKLSAAVKAGTDKLMEKLGDAYDAFVEAVKDAAKNVKDTAEQLPDWIYDYLYNNPEKVIAFFNEYGDDAIAFLNEYKEEALMVLGYVALNFGEDMLDLVLDNADEILKKSVELLNEHGENAWALIKVYLDELGIDLEEVAKDTLTAAAEAVKDLVAQYAKEAYEYAYNYAKDKGIVTAITDALDALNEKLDAAAKWVEENAKALGDELYTELMDEINAAKALIADIKATIKNAVELGTDTVAKIQQMLTDLGATLETIADMLRNCDCNLGEEAWSYFQNTVKPATIEKLNDAVKAGASWLVDKLGDAYDAFVDAVVEAAKEYAPEVADWIYDYLYNNAEDVIAFFNKYGDDAIAFLNEFKEEVMAVLGYVAVNFGEDALEFVMDNAEEILKKTVEWLEKHGENAWKLIKVYLEELGLLENLPTEDDVQNILDKVTDVLDKFGPAVEDELLGLTDKVITELKTAVEELIDLIETELKNATGEAKEKLEELYDAAQELKAAIEKLVEEGVDAAIAEVQAALNAVADAVEDAIAVVSEEAAAKLNEITEGIKAALNEAYIEATTVKYVRHEDSYYVALGDGTAASESYVDALAEELDIEYKNLAEEGMLVEDAYALLKTNAADIKKADLITIGFGNNTFVNEVVAQVLNGETPDFAWETYVGEEGLPYVEDALADVHEYFVESGVDGTAMGVEDMPALLTSAVEAYAFNCVSYACNLPELINAIRQINGEATIVIVGMYNSLQDVTVTLGGTEFELTEYVDYLVDAAGVHALTYSMVTGNSVYVAAPDVETNLTDKELNVLDLMREFMLYQGKNLNPSEDGHEYIKDQIMNAMDTKFDIAFANMTLANSLAMNFAFEQGHMSDWTGSYAQIVKTYADGRDDVVATIPASEWGQAGISGVAYYTISFNGIAAKEMTDEIYVTIYNAEGEAVSNVWEDTVRDYASRVLSNASSNKETQVMVVDMLNYGAGAQSFFKYNTEDLANGELTEAQKALATKNIETANSLVKGEKYLGTSLTLESKILLNMAFQGATSDMKAEVSFTDHYGNKKVSEAELKVSGNVAVVDIDQIAVADAREMVTVTIYNADGSVYGTATDSVESYIARISELDPLFELIMKFADSAHAFFH